MNKAPEKLSGRFVLQADRSQASRLGPLYGREETKKPPIEAVFFLLRCGGLQTTPSDHPKSLDFDVPHEAGASTMLAIANIGFGVSSAGMIDIMRNRRLLTLLVMLGLLAGCASAPGPMPEDPVARYGTIAVVPALYVPDHDFLPYAKGPTAGALKGALGGVGTSAYVGAEIALEPGGSRDDWGKPLAGVLITIALLPILVPMGAIEDSQAALPIEHVERLERSIHSAVEQAQLHHQLARQIAESTTHLPLVQHEIKSDFGPTSPQHRPDYRDLNTIGIDTVLEVAVRKARFKTVGKGSSSHANGVIGSGRHGKYGR